MIVVAVHHLDIDPRLGHASRDLSELSGFVLFQTLHEDFSIRDNANPGGLERVASGEAVREEKVRDAGSVVYEDPATFDADTGAAKGLAHFRECAGTILELDR